MWVNNATREAKLGLGLASCMSCYAVVTYDNFMGIAIMSMNVMLLVTNIRLTIVCMFCV